MRTGLAFIAWLLVIAALPASAAAPITGTWKAEKGGQVLKIKRCPSGAVGLCAHVVRSSAGPKAEKAGARIMWGLTDVGKFWKGKGYSAGNKASFRAEVSREGGRLKVKGCKAFICRTSWFTPAN